MARGKKKSQQQKGAEGFDRPDAAAALSAAATGNVHGAGGDAALPGGDTALCGGGLYREVPLSKGQRRLQRRKQQLEQDRHTTSLAVLKSDNRGQVELQAMHRALAASGLQLLEVPSDGNCLFRAIASVLKREGGHASDLYCHLGLRQRSANHILNKSDDYAAFIVTADESIEEYCNRMKSSNDYGGDAELRALSDILCRSVYVFTVDCEPIIFGESYSVAGTGTQPVRLSFHKDMFALGAHYNAVIPAD